MANRRLIGLVCALQRILVGGCRAHRGGLHLGHVYGCFSDIAEFKEELYFFVVSDCAETDVASSERSMLEICLDVLALIPDRRIVLVRESRIRSSLAPLTTAIEQLLPIRLLEAAHPHRKLIKAGAYRGSVGDLVFPVHQASYLVGLGCRVACYNDDNANAVAFARECARRVNRWAGRRFLEDSVELVSRSPSRLLGLDGRRMSKSNDNFLSLTEREASVRRYVRRALGRAVKPDIDVDRAGVQDIERGYLRLLDIPEADVSMLTGRERFRMIEDSLVDWLGRFKRRRAEADSAVGPLGVATLLTEGESLADRLIKERLRGMARFG